MEESEKAIDTSALDKELRKAKLIYSGELLLFVAVFLVLGILILVGVIGVADWKRIAFTFLTLAGSIWLIADFIWTLRSPRKRAKNSLLDKCMVLPVALFNLGFDIAALCLGWVFLEDGEATSPWFRFVIGGDLCYLAACYLVQAIYHYFHLHPALRIAYEEELEEMRKAQENPTHEEPIGSPDEEAPKEVPAEPAEEPKE